MHDSLAAASAAAVAVLTRALARLPTSPPDLPAATAARLAGLPLEPADRAAVAAVLADAAALAETESQVLPAASATGPAAGAIPVFAALPQSPDPARPLPRCSLRADTPLTQVRPGAPDDPQAGSDLATDLARLALRPALALGQLADVLLALLQRHAWSAPNPLGRCPEVPLADFARLHAALLASRFVAVPDLTLPLALVGFDLSGIQAFIYDISSTKAARSLKGRSFYLHVLAENVVSLLLAELGLSRAHVVYASGGGAYVLAPNTARLVEQVEALRHALAAEFSGQHKNRLFLALAAEPLALAELHDAPLKNAWRRLSEKISQQKRRRFQEQLLSDFAGFFEPTEQGGEAAQDAVTGDELPPNAETFKLDPDNPALLVSAATYQHVELGRTLASSRGLDTGRRPVAAPLAEATRLLRPVGPEHWAVLYRERENNYHRATGTRSELFNQPDFLGTDFATGYQLYGGNDYPRAENAPDAPADYDTLAGSEGSGLRRLGILRMDVDGLGQIFIGGFAGGRRSLAHYATMSRALDWFFKGYLNTVWADPAEEFSRTTSLVYSGGDDLFVVGRWDQAIRLADRIQRDFSTYTGGALSLSGGVAVLPPRFPISRAARLAEEAEKQAKDHKARLPDGREQAKNAFSLLGTPVNWTHEWPLVQQLHETLTQLLREGKLPRSVLRSIYEFNEQRQLAEDKKAPPRWRWQMAYDFSRLRQRLSDRPTAQAWLEAVETAATTSRWQLPSADTEQHYDNFLPLLTLAARWAELTLRAGDPD